MRSIIFLAFFSFFLSCSISGNSFLSDQIQVDGLQKSVEILRDQWGINHIYAHNPERKIDLGIRYFLIKFKLMVYKNQLKY